MKSFFKEIKRAKGWLFVVGLVLILVTISTGYFLYILKQFNNVENMIRLIVAIVVGLLWLFCAFKLIQSLFKRKIKRYVRVCFLSILFSAIVIVIASGLSVALDKLSGFTTNKTTYSSSIVTLKTNKATDIKSIGKKDIGMLNDKKSVDGYEIPNQIIKDNSLKNKIVKFEGYPKLLDALLKGDIDYVFLPTNYEVMFSSMESYKDIGKKTKIVYTQKKEVKNVSSAGKKITEPFTVLLMGVDSTLDDVRNSAYNGDSLMLVTFNPKTLNTTMLSIPRDTYVPIACFNNQRRNKITHAAAYGDDCMMKTIETFTGIKIDYYAKINFKGVVKLVDTLGGVDIDVPFAICEQNSNREWGNKTVYIKEGKQTLNGEQALAWARHREEVYSSQFCSAEWVGNGVVNDFVRSQNQQEIVKALLNKTKAVRDLDTLMKFLDSLGNTMVTNMSRDQILSLYNVLKDIMLKSKDMPMEDLLSMQKLYIEGYDDSVYDYSQIDGSGMGLSLYNFIPDKHSLRDVINAMKINLEKAKPKMIKEFSFDINEDYEEFVVGKNVKTGGGDITHLPDFTGYNKSEAIAFASQHGFKITIKETTGSTMGMIVNQDLPGGRGGMDVRYVTNLTIYVVTSTGSKAPVEEPSEEEEPEEAPVTPEVSPEVPPTTPDIPPTTIPGIPEESPTP